MGWDSTYLHMNESVEAAMLKEYGITKLYGSERIAVESLLKSV